MRHPKEEEALIPEINLYTDGACRGNPGEGAIALLIIDINGKERRRGYARIGQTTNNKAEYMALEEGLKNARDISTGTVNCYLDSELVVRQVREEWRINNDDLRMLFERVLLQEQHFKEVTYSHVRRNHPMIRIVDSLANKALDQEGSPNHQKSRERREL